MQKHLHELYQVMEEMYFLLTNKNVDLWVLLSLICSWLLNEFRWYYQQI